MKHNTDRYTGCRIPVCDRNYFAKGFCKAHYYQAKRSGGYVPNLPVAPQHPRGLDKKCTETDCTKKHHSRGLCHTHYTRLIRSERRKARESRKNLLTGVR